MGIGITVIIAVNIYGEFVHLLSYKNFSDKAIKYLETFCYFGPWGFVLPKVFNYYRDFLLRDFIIKRL